MEATLRRVAEVKNATIGRLSIGDLHFWTLEDLWRNNEPMKSCIPASWPNGTAYKAVPHGWGTEPTKFKKVWRLLDVPGREAILIHNGNYDKDTLGCILVGLGVQGDMITNSKEAIDQLRTLIWNNEFILTIVDLPRPELGHKIIET